MNIGALDIWKVTFTYEILPGPDARRYQRLRKFNKLLLPLSIYGIFIISDMFILTQKCNDSEVFTVLKTDF
jgi:hypothetical protein